MWELLLDPGSETYKVLDAKNLLVPGSHVYDLQVVLKRGDIYWDRAARRKLLAQGWDAFWLDSAEPEEFWPHMGDGILRNKKLAMGNGAEYTNVFPLLHTLGVQDHWKAATQSKRVFLPHSICDSSDSRRVGATVWSGDVYGNYWGLSHQIPAGLNFALVGVSLLDNGHRLVTGRPRQPPWPIPPTRSFTRGGLSSAPSARFSAPTATAQTTSCGRSTRSSRSCSVTTNCATG